MVAPPWRDRRLGRGLVAKIFLPGSDEHYITMPDEWLGKHARRHDEAADKSKGLPSTWRDFTVAMALLDDWHLPGLPKNPEQWEIEIVSLPVMAWVKMTVLASYYACFDIAKNSWPPLLNHSTAAAETLTEAAGDLTTSA